MQYGNRSGENRWVGEARFTIEVFSETFLDSYGLDE